MISISAINRIAVYIISPISARKEVVLKNREKNQQGKN
jgi:hypothetical protein